MKNIKIEALARVFFNSWGSRSHSGRVQARMCDDVIEQIGADTQNVGGGHPPPSPDHTPQTPQSQHS